jgi:hypothetical protein
MSATAWALRPRPTMRSDVAEQVKAGAEQIFTRNVERCAALIDADRLDGCHRLERERIHLRSIDDARRRLADIAAGRTQDAAAAIAGLQACRANTRPAGNRSTVKAAGPARKRGQPLVRVELTASVMQRVAAIEAFPARARAGFACDKLLDELRSTVILNLRRLPRTGRRHLDQPPHSARSAGPAASPERRHDPRSHRPREDRRAARGPRLGWCSAPMPPALEFATTRCTTAPPSRWPAPTGWRAAALRRTRGRQQRVRA